MNLQNPDTVSPIEYEEDKPHEVRRDHLRPLHAEVHAGQRATSSGSARSPPGLKLKEARRSASRRSSRRRWCSTGSAITRSCAACQLGKLYVGEAIKLDVPVEAETLVDGLKGPLVVLQREGRSTHLVCQLRRAAEQLAAAAELSDFHATTRCNSWRSEPTWTCARVFPPGATPKIPRTNLQKAETRGSPSRS